MHDQRGIVTSVEKGQATTLRLELSIKESDKTILRDAFGQVTINGTDRLDE